MGLFDFIFRPKKKSEDVQQAVGYFKTLTAYRPVFTSWDGALYESELCRAAIHTVATHVSKLDIKVLGSARPQLCNQLKHGMNQWQTNSQFLYRMATILYCTNTCFIVPVYDQDERTTGYFPVLPQRCALIDMNGEPWLRYTFANGQRAAVPFVECAVLTRHQYKDDFFGEKNTALDETMNLIHIQNQGVSEAIKNSATYRFMAQLNNFSKAEDLAKERKAFSETNFSAESGGGGMLLFPNTYTNIKQLDQQAYTVNAAQLNIIRTNVFEYFGVNEEILQNKAGSADLWSSFYEGAIEPVAIQFSEVMTKAAFTVRERAAGAQIMATSNRLQYMTNSDKLSYVTQLTDRGILSINDALDILNMPHVEGGDVRTIRGEYKNVEDINDNSAAKEGEENEAD